MLTFDTLKLPAKQLGLLLSAAAVTLCCSARAAPEPQENTAIRAMLPELAKIEFYGQIKADEGLTELTRHFLGQRASIELIENLQREVSRYCQQQGFLNAQTLFPSGRTSVPARCSSTSAMC